MTRFMLEPHGQAVTPVRSSQSRDSPDIADAPYTEATGPSDARSPLALTKHSRPPEVADTPDLDLENPPASVPTSRRSFEGTPPRFSTSPPLVQITYSPLERLALSIEDLITSTGGTLTQDADEMLSSLERCLTQADIPSDSLAVLAAAARDPGCQTSS